MIVRIASKGFKRFPDLGGNSNRSFVNGALFGNRGCFHKGLFFDCLRNFASSGFKLKQKRPFSAQDQHM
jgi:hypothetical protein